MINIPDSKDKRVVILGGGFAGLQLANRLKKGKYQIVMIDRNNFHQFQPLFYQVATAGIEPSGILFPLRKVFSRWSNVILRISKVEKIDVENKVIETKAGTLTYDKLVIAMGATTSYFGMESIEKNSMPMKSVTQALAIRNKLLKNFEKAIVCDDEELKLSLMTIVVVGGGPTGTEVAGALAEMKKHVFPKEYSELDISKIRIVLVEASPKILNGFDVSLSDKSKEYLERIGVEVKLQTQVVGYEEGNLNFADGTSISTQNLIWAAGIKGRKVKGLPAEAVLPNGRIKVDAFNQVEGVKDVYAIGDICIQTADERYSKGHPQVAQVAMQQGEQVAKNLLAELKGKAPQPFRYKNLGSMATIGRHLAVVQLPWVKIKGGLAWYIWMFVHLMSILGVKNKLFVFLNWMWSYISFDQSLRLIISKEDKEE